MKKAIVVVLALMLVLGVSSFAMAATDSSTFSCPFWGANAPQLKITDEQKAKITSLFSQMFEVRKEVLNQNVADGTITEDQAEFMEERMNAKKEAMESGQWGPGMGRHGMRGGYAPRTQAQ